jgi:hypothetical protein
MKSVALNAKGQGNKKPKKLLKEDDQKSVY